MTDDGEVWSFGCNDEGALGRDTSEEGSEYKASKVDLPTDCIRITAGDSHSAFLLSDGRVFACGAFRDSHGTMGLNMKGKQQYPIEVVPGIDFVDIKSGADHLVMLSSLGKVYTVGCAEQGQLGRVSMRSSSGETRRGKGQLLEPGLVIGRNINFIDAIWATTYCTFIRNRANGSVYGFGLNNYNQLGIVKKNTETIFSPQKTPFEDVKDITGKEIIVLKKIPHKFVINVDFNAQFLSSKVDNTTRSLLQNTINVLPLVAQITVVWVSATQAKKRLSS